MMCITILRFSVHCYLLPMYQQLQECTKKTASELHNGAVMVTCLQKAAPTRIVSAVLKKKISLELI
jgi:hypothetical protein